MKPGFVFFGDSEEPTIVPILARKFNLPRYIVTARAYRAKKHKTFNGQRCPVLTSEDLKPPMTRRTTSPKKYVIHLVDSEVIVLRKILDRVTGRGKAEKAALDQVRKAVKPESNGVDLWNSMVRKKNG
jgi:hypothetical protein